MVPRTGSPARLSPLLNCYRYVVCRLHFRGDGAERAPALPGRLGDRSDFQDLQVCCAAALHSDLSIADGRNIGFWAPPTRKFGLVSVNCLTTSRRSLSGPRKISLVMSLRQTTKDSISSRYVAPWHLTSLSLLNLIYCLVGSFSSLTTLPNVFLVRAW